MRYTCIMKRLRRIGLVRRFAISALLVFTLVALVLLTLMTGQIRTSEESSAQFHATFVANSILRYELTPADLATPVSPQRAAQIEAFAKARVTQYPTLRVKVWRPDGTIVFSDDARAIGLKFSDDLRERALDSNAPVSEVASPTDAENIYEKNLRPKLFSTYVPLHLPGHESDPPQGLVEVYQDYAGIQAAIDNVSRALIITLVMALAGLYILLLPLAAGAARDLRERNLALGRSEKRFRSLVQNSSDVISIVEARGIVTYASPSVQTVFGLEPETLAGSKILDVVHPDDRDALQTVLDLAARNPSVSYPTQCRWMHHDGSWRNGESIVTGRLDDDSIGGIVVNTRDVTERHAMEQQLLQQAFHDPLTRLANRALLGNRLQQALDRGHRESRPASVIFIDLDDFKTVNDSLGHEAGDQLLIAVGTRISEVLRPADTAARLGGDEFALLVEDATLADAIRVVERTLDALRAPFTISGREISVTASAGISVAADDNVSAADMLRNADIAMYSAKSAGKARFEVYQAEMYHATIERLEMRSGLEEALSRDQFVLHYQPVMDLRGSTITGVEALIRWDHPERGLVAPLQFIPVAEESGIIVPIGRWVLRQACLDGQRLRRQHPDAEGLVMGVNLSMRQLRYTGIVGDVSAALDVSGLPAANLLLEVTESLVMHEPEEVISRLRELKALGVRIAIDDFGTGYSSLSYLQRLPIDILKVDRSFVSIVAAPEQDWSLCGAIVKIAASLHLETIAEGIETAEQKAQLILLGCESGQGFLFHRPKAIDEIDRLLATGGMATHRQVRSLGA
jgi:diguanylate cyclase (GGDEF)-like protein/PAS domain S-box-containing protein